MTLGTTTDIQHSTTLTRRTSVGATPETKMLYLHVKSEHKLLEVAKKKRTKFPLFPIGGSHPHVLMIMSTSQQMFSSSQEEIPYYTWMQNVR